MTTLQTALLLFALAALGGVAMLAYRIQRGLNPPIGLATLHGGAAAFALVTLGVAVFGQGQRGLALVAFAIFGVGALGGASLFTMHMRGRLLPVALILVHGTAAVVAFVLLAIAAFGPR